MRNISNLRERIAVRPHLRYHGIFKQWHCSSHHGSLVGRGSTAEAAWKDWKIRSQRFSRIPRKGVINRRDCMDWFRHGCFSVNALIGNKIQYGYDPITDELILQG